MYTNWCFKINNEYNFFAGDSGDGDFEPIDCEDHDSNEDDEDCQVVMMNLIFGFHKHLDFCHIDDKKNKLNVAVKNKIV